MDLTNCVRIIALSAVLGLIAGERGSADEFLSSTANITSQTGASLAYSSSTTDLLQSCQVFAIDAIDLPAQETGILTEVTVVAGQHVEAKTIIARVDDATVRMEQAVATLDSKIAREVAEDNTDILFAEAVLEEAKTALKSYEEIERRGSASDVEMRSKKLAVEQAELKVRHAKNAQKQLVVKSELSLRSLQATTERLARFEVRAPFAATVTEVTKRNGEWVQAGQSVASLVRLDELRVDGFVSIHDQHPSKLVGRSVTVELSSKSDPGKPIRVAGVISHFDPDVNSFGIVRIHATVQNFRQNGHWQLLPGMIVAMHIDP